MAEPEPLLRTYFRSQIAISESRSVYCTLHLRPLRTSGFVTLYHLVCRVHRFAVEQSSFRNGSAIRTAGWRKLNPSRLSNNNFLFFLASSFVIRKYYCILRLRPLKKLFICRSKSFSVAFFRRAKREIRSKDISLQEWTQAKREKATSETVMCLTPVSL